MTRIHRYGRARRWLSMAEIELGVLAVQSLAAEDKGAREIAGGRKPWRHAEQAEREGSESGVSERTQRNFTDRGRPHQAQVPGGRDFQQSTTARRTGGSSIPSRWACTYRIANFSLGGPDIGKGPADPGYPPTSLRPTGLEARPLCQGRSRLSNSGRRRHPLFSTLCPCKDKTGRGCFARALAKPLPVSRRRPGLSRGTVAVGAGGCPSRRP